MTKELFINKLRELYDYGKSITDRPSFNCWKSELITIFLNYSPNFDRQIEIIRKTNGFYGIDSDIICSIQAQIQSVINVVESGMISFSESNKINYNERLELIFRRFRLVANQLKHRHDNRATINIDDEYDVQDLLHALLKIDFDDIRAEEWTPSYAGSSLRMDFLLKEIDTVIEVKKTRKSMSIKDLGEQLIIDIEKYRNHPNCKTLYCFVYDTDMYISNPKGIKEDLENNHKGFLKVVIIQ